jgi:protein-disulfide isomerase
MGKSMKKRTTLLFALLFTLSALLIACGPAGVAGPTATGAATAERTGAEPAGLTAASTAVDANGLPVGFTAEGRPFRGDLAAPIVMEEFSDYQCPYCASFSAESLPGLLQNQVANGEVVIIYYDFPLNSIHPQAAAAANAARCAGENGPAAYWAMHDRLFADMAEWSHGEANVVFAGYAEELGFGGEAFAACLAEDRHAEAVAADQVLGQSRGVSSTPTFFLNGQPVVGAYPLDYFNQAIAAISAGETITAPQAEEPQGPTVAPTPAAILEDDSAVVRGEADAPVTIVEYTDYQCPYCLRHSAETMPRLISEMIATGRVRYVVKDFPLDSIHPEARSAAMAARCAGEQDAYWEMHDALFAAQGEWSGLGAGAAEVYATLAAGLGLDASAFAACLDSGRHDAVVQANQDEGIDLGVTGTPAFFINGYPISGAQPYELFEYAIGLAEEGMLGEAYVAQEPQQQPTPSGPVEVNSEGAFSIGETDAPVTIIEFTDFQCPFCSRHALETYPQIKAEYVDTGRVRYVFMDFPLSSIHPQAQLTAEAARCAGDQGQFVAMHDLLFSRQQEWAGRDDAAELLAGYAGELGLDEAAFAECLSSGVHRAAVLADLEEGVRVGVDGTPAFFINGVFVSGAQPFEVFQEVIEGFLAEEG